MLADGQEDNDISPVSLHDLEKKLLSEIRRRGIQDPGVRTLLQDVVLASNKVAMRLLAKGRTDISLECLRKAELLFDPAQLKEVARAPEILALRALTLNNLACWFRQQGQLHTALAYLEEAEKIGEATCGNNRAPSSPNAKDYLNPLADEEEEDDEGSVQSQTSQSYQQIAVTHSNLCAILSELGRHDEALSHAKQAVAYCKQELRLVIKRNPPDGKAGQGWELGSVSGNRVSTASSVATPTPPKLVLKTLAALAIACYNLAVEMEFTEGKKCIQWYQRSLELAYQARAQEDVLSRIQKSSEAANKKWSQNPRKSKRSLQSSMPIQPSNPVEEDDEECPETADEASVPDLSLKKNTAMNAKKVIRPSTGIKRAQQVP